MAQMDSKKIKLALKRSMNYHLKCSLCEGTGADISHNCYHSIALSVRDRLIQKMLHTDKRYRKEDRKRVYYLSMEFLIGKLLRDNLCNLGIYDTCAALMSENGLTMEEVAMHERDAGLGNGGLGRLAACFIDSMATLGISGFGYGIHYEYGLFKQDIDNGYQQEKPDNWLVESNPWETRRFDESCLVPVYGRIEHGVDREGNYNPMWLDWHTVVGVPHDIAIPGYGGQTVNWLRLFSAAPSHEFDIQIFNEGDYFRAVEQQIATETISKILYPSDKIAEGQELRLVQEYFLVTCSLRDIIRRYLREHDTINQFADFVAIQMNDTHPSLAVAELMRLLVDEYALPWEDAWEITCNTLSYTNHTVLPEALESWPVGLLERVIPRHLQIIYEINERFLRNVRAQWPEDEEKIRRTSLIEEGKTKKVRMAHLAIVGSHSVNGVSHLHTEILKKEIFRDFSTMWPEKFINVTNGITQRRWLLECNPGLSKLITDTIGDSWITNLDALKDLEPHASDASFQEEFLSVKRSNKAKLAKITAEFGFSLTNPDSLFDVQAKRIHMYKRQLLKVMHVILEYLEAVNNGKFAPVPKTYIFAGKAAPGYWEAKQVIKLIHNVGRTINGDPRVKDLMQVLFVPDYKVTTAEILIPATDLSEQISTAGMEASGTGNMKFALNGALTVGTLDGANIEIMEEVGKENIFIFGHTAEALLKIKNERTYHPEDYYRTYPEIRLVINAFRDDLFCPSEPGLFRWIYDKTMSGNDPYFHLADFMDYLNIQKRIGEEYHDKRLWQKKAILNVARMGKFSSDRSILEYATKIWNVQHGHG